MSGRIGVRTLLLACFFLSGVAGLIYEVVWTRMLVLVFGTTTFAVSTVLTAFMAGLGFGAFLFGRIVDKWQRPLLLYGLLELLIGLYALLVPDLFQGLVPLYRILWQQFAPSFYLFSLLRFLLASAVLLLPTTLMGGTLPALSRFYVKKRETVGLHVGFLYGLNTLGAVLGAAAAGFLLLPEVGMERAMWVAVSLNLAVSLFALVVATKEEPSKKGVRPVRQLESKPALPEPPSGTLPPSLVLAALATFGLSGFAAMAYEVAWTRLLSLILGPSTYAFTTMLVAFLTGLALGGLLMAGAVDRLPRPLLILALLELGIGLSAFFGQRFFGELPYLSLLLFRSFSAQPNLLLVSQSLLAFLVMFVPTLLMGAVFPVVVRISTDHLAKVGRLVGNAYAVNTVGTVAGSFASGFLLLPTLGIQGTIALAIGLNLFLGFLLLFFDQRKGSAARHASVGGEVDTGLKLKGRLLLGAGTATAFVLFVAFAFPAAWDPRVMTSGVYKEAPLFLRLYPSPREVFHRITSQFKLLFYREGVGATVTVVERPSLEYAPHLSLALDGKVDASTASDMPTQVLSGHLPFLIGEKAEKVLVIGLASGMTVGAVAQHPVKRITVVEIEPAVVEASHLFDPFNHRPLEDPRVNLIVDDGRNYLLAAKERFDVIISEPSNPWMSGPAKLFTKEFFELGKDRLTKDGIFVQWLQLYGMEPSHLKALVRTFHSVFPHLLIFQTAEGDLLLLGSGRPLVIDLERLAQRMLAPKIASDLARVGIRDPLDLLVKFRLGSAEIDAYVGLSGPLNTDDNGLIEFAAPKSLSLETASVNVKELRQASRGVAGYVSPMGGPEDVAAFFLGLAKRYLLSNEPDEAERVAREAMAVDEAAGFWVLGEVHLRREEEERAQEAWRKALKINPSFREALMSLALFSHHRARFQEAEKYLGRLTKLRPSDPLIAFYQGLNRYFLGDETGASARLSSALEKGLFETEGQDRYFRLGGLGEAPLARYYLSLAFEKLGQKALALRVQETFLRNLTEWRWRLEERPIDLSQVSPLNLLLFHLDRGIQIPEETALATEIHRRVGDPLIHYYKGTTALFLGYPEEAKAELSAALHALSEDSDRSLAHYYLGLAYLKLNDLSLAASSLEAFLKGLSEKQDQRYRQADTYRHLEEIYLALGRPDEAERIRRLKEEARRAIM